MHLVPSAIQLALVFSVARVNAGRGHRQHRRLVDDADGPSTTGVSTTSTDDLAQITAAPGPPTIEPGIPALQPSVPTTGIPSLSIPPAHQTSSLKPSDRLPWQSADPQATGTFSVPSSALAPAIAPSNYVSAIGGSGSVPISTSTSIPFLSELLTPPFARSSFSTTSSVSAIVPTSSSHNSQSTTLGTWSPQETTRGSATPLSVVGGDPKDGALTASMPSTLVYSFTLPPYSGGLDTSGIAETMTLSSSAADKDHVPSATIYSYSLPPYTPKIPTYVATSAGLAPVSMTSGAPGNPVGNAPTTKVFLQQGSVDPTKDVPTIATSSMVPLYSPACLGNAYGGGYVVTPTVSVINSNANATGIAKIPPAYGFTYKLEPTQSPSYSAAVVVVDTKGPIPSGASLSNAPSAGSSIGLSNSGNGQNFAPIAGTPCPCTGASTVTSTITTQGLNIESFESVQRASTSSDSISTVNTAATGITLIGPARVTSSVAASATSSGPSIAPDKLSSIASGLVNGTSSTGVSGSGASATGFGTAVTEDAYANSTPSLPLPIITGIPSGITTQVPPVTTAPSSDKGSASDKLSSIEPYLVGGSQSAKTMINPSGSSIALNPLNNIGSFIHNILQSTDVSGSAASAAGLSSEFNSGTAQASVATPISVSATADTPYVRFAAAHLRLPSYHKVNFLGQL
ncbi:MAG: hypothetical protein Q9201_005252 [Fulgogasparrea decipioides]